MNSFTIFAIWVALSGVVVAARNDCGYYAVQEQYTECKEALFEPVRSVSGVSLALVQTSCRNKGAFFSCMDGYAQSCDNREVIMQQARAALQWCDGNNAADWMINDVIPATETVTLECVQDLEPNFGTCTSTYDIISVLQKQPLLEALEGIKTVTKVFFRCIKNALKETVAGYNGTQCPGLTWQNMYKTLWMLFSSQPAPLGMTLADSDITGLENEDAGQQLKREGLPFPWLKINNADRQLKREGLPFPWLKSNNADRQLKREGLLFPWLKRNYF